MANASWGDPSNNTFRKHHIREAKQGENRANVNILIRPLVEELWTEWDQAGIAVAGIQSVDSDPLGLTFSVDPNSMRGDKADELADHLGFSRGDDCYYFDGAPEWARSKGEELDSRNMAEIANVFTPEPVDGHRPGSRELKFKDIGPDVSTLQVFLDVPMTGTFDKITATRLSEFQQQNNLTVNGVAGEEFWGFIIPRTIRWRRMGEGGREIRLVQAALVAFGYQGAPATGRYGMITNTALYHLRGEKGIAGSTKIDRLVWESLFDLQWQYGALPLSV